MPFVTDPTLPSNILSNNPSPNLLSPSPPNILDVNELTNADD